MTSVDDAPPNEVLLDLIQSYRGQYSNISDLQLISNTHRYREDPLPSLHCLLDTANPEQRSIGSGKKVLDRVRVKLVYYSADNRDIWKMYQTIKQIIVGNNQVKSTSQYPSTGIEWSVLGDVDFDVFEINREVELNYFDMVVEAVFQDNY